MTRTKPTRHAARCDWTAAREFYLELGLERRFSTVALKFGVSDTAVRRHADEDGWRERAVAFDRDVAEAIGTIGVRTRADRVIDTIKLVDAARIR